MTLTDRYIAATIAHLPPDQRAEVQAELQASIADAVEASPGESASAEREVLEDLGDPERLAATYANRPLALIGPKFYLEWKRLLRLLTWIVVPIIAVLSGTGSAIAGEGFWGIVRAVWVSSLTTTVFLGFFVTLVFALLERYAPEEDVTGPWTVDNLSDTPAPEVHRGETILSAAMLALGAVFIIWQHVSPWTRRADGEGLAIINPDLWSFVLPAVLAVIAIELVVVIRRHARGRWTMRDWWVTLALNVASLALVLPPLLQERFLNRDLFTEIGWPDAASPISLEQTEWIVAGIVVVTALTDALPAWRKARSSERSG